jgi:hypothetical protein
MFQPISADPPVGQVRRVAFVPFLHDGPYTGGKPHRTRLRHRRGSRLAWRSFLSGQRA